MGKAAADDNYTKIELVVIYDMFDCQEMVRFLVIFRSII